MAKIELFPLVITEEIMTDRPQAVALMMRLAKFATTIMGLEPLLAVAKQHGGWGALSAYADWTDQNTADVIDVTVPFMRMPEDQARGILQQASFLERGNAFIKATEYLTQATSDMIAVVEKMEKGKNN